MIRVAFLNIDDSLGGASIASNRIARSLIDKGLNVTVFTQNKKKDISFIKLLGKGLSFRLRTKFNFYFERLYFLFFEKNRNIRFGFSPSVIGLNIAKRVDLSRYDIIHIHWTNFGYLSLDGLAKIFDLQIPIVWTLHDMWAFTGGCHHSGDCLKFQDSCGNCVQYLKNPNDNDLSFDVYNRKRKVYAKLTNFAAVGCSKWIAHRAKKSQLFRLAHVINIPNPINTEEFYPIKQSLREEFGLEENKKYILFVAMKASIIWKGFPYLKEALNELAKKVKHTEHYELLLIGEAEEGELNSLPFKSHLFGRIDDIEQLNKIYNIADVFVIPSIQENLPNTIMESMATGTPTVGFEIGGIPEMIAHKETGYLAKYKNSQDLAQGLFWVLNEADIDAIAVNCIQKVKNEYGMSVVGSKYSELYSEVLSSKSSTRISFMG